MARQPGDDSGKVWGGVMVHVIPSEVLELLGGGDHAVGVQRLKDYLRDMRGVTLIEPGREMVPPVVGASASPQLANPLPANALKHSR